MNNGLFTYLAALLLFGSNGIFAAAIALPSSDIVLLRTFLGALSLVTILAITQRHKLQAPSRPREAAADVYKRQLPPRARRRYPPPRTVPTNVGIEINKRNESG